jgi:hypothetical protein
LAGWRVRLAFVLCCAPRRLLTAQPRSQPPSRISARWRLDGCSDHTLSAVQKQGLEAAKIIPQTKR